MSDNPIELRGPQGREHGHVRLPLTQQDFRDFIVGLLGRPQTISRNIRGPFAVGVDEIVALHDSIDQRLTQQNDATFVQLVCVVTFDDGSSVQLSGLNELTTYNELRKIVSTGVVLEWTYLVQFNDRDYPEKQVITVDMNTRGRIRRTQKAIQTHDGLAISTTVPAGSMQIRIAHTARTWGADIESMLANILDSYKRKPSAFRSFLDNNSGKVGLAVFGGYFATSIASGFYVSKKFAELQTAKLLDAFHGLSPDKTASIDTKLQYLAEAIASGIWSRHYLMLSAFIMVSVILSIVFGLWAGFAADQRYNSFLLLTKHSYEHRDDILEDERSETWEFARSLGFAVAAGVVSNFVFYLLRCRLDF